MSRGNKNNIKLSDVSNLILPALGTVGGFALGGPGGAALGGSLASALAGGIDAYDQSIEDEEDLEDDEELQRKKDLISLSAQFV